MRLERKYIDIRNVVFGQKTFIKDHALHIDREELLDLLRDSRFGSVEIDIALPGESCRIANVGDVVQPMCKPRGATFPGVIDKVDRVGLGETIVLRGVSVAEVCEVFIAHGSVIDMSGPGAEHTEIAKTRVVTIDARPAKGIPETEYLHALNIASKRAAKYLAECGRDVPPDETKVFEHAPLVSGKLPRVAYIFQVFSHAPLTDFTYYGDNCHSMLPIIVHPQELIDGALLNRNYSQLANADPSYLYQNQPMVLELLSRHNKDINFVGVVMSNTPAQVEDKRRNAMMATGLVKYHLRADGVVITKEGGGHPQIDIQLNCEMSESLGVKSVIVISEFLSLNNSIDEVVVFNSPAANAMVSSGCLEKISLPRMAKVIGGMSIPDPTTAHMCDPRTAFEHENRYIRGALSQLGGTWYSSEVY